MVVSGDHSDGIVHTEDEWSKNEKLQKQLGTSISLIMYGVINFKTYGTSKSAFVFLHLIIANFYCWLMW